MRAPAKDPPVTEYLNVDLEVRSRSNLKDLANALSRRLFVLHVGREGRGYLASFEAGAGNRATPDAAIRHLLRAIDELPQRTGRIWQKARDRVFDIGVSAPKGKSAVSLPLELRTLAAVVRHHARVAVTVYAS